MAGPVIHDVSHSASQYRPDINGLRALAVVAVVAYHAFPGLVPGGFVGVDVFFVISGFLITRIIVHDFDEKKFSYSDFYARRIKRIFPALVLVLSTSLAIGWMTFLPDEFRMLGSHIFAGAGFWINFTFHREAGYFDPATIYKPLLHLWSLAIEEQFYLLWPPIIALSRLLRQKTLTVGLMIVGLSFATNLILMMSSTVAAFYLPWPRAWELLLGGCLACARPRDWQPWLSGIASVSGLAIILLAMFAFTATTPFPGWRAVMPIIGTMLLIAAGPTSTLSQIFLAHPVLIFLGLISYPLYLWHWPLISIPEIIGQTGPWIRAVGVAISIALAWVTYRFVELPIRRSGKATAIALVAVMIVVATTGWLAKHSVLPPRANSAELHEILRAPADWLSPPGTSFALPFENQTFWKLGTSNELALIIGDSNAEMYFPRAQKLASIGASRLSPVFAFYPACIPIPDVASIQVPKCTEFIAAAFRFAKRPEIKTVVVAAQWFLADAPGRTYFPRAGKPEVLGAEPGRREAFDSLRDRLIELRELGKRTIVIATIPVGFEFDPKARVNRSILEGVKIVPAQSIDIRVLLNRHPLTDRALRRAASESKSELIDPANFLCNPHCSNSDEGGLPIYKDSDHLRASYVRQNASFFDQVLR